MAVACRLPAIAGFIYGRTVPGLRRASGVGTAGLDAFSVRFKADEDGSVTAARARWRKTACLSPCSYNVLSQQYPSSRLTGVFWYGATSSAWTRAMPHHLARCLYACSKARRAAGILKRAHRQRLSGLRTWHRGHRSAASSAPAAVLLRTAAWHLRGCWREDGKRRAK